MPAFKTELKNANDAKQEAELKVVAAQGKVAAAQQKLNDLIARADSQQRALDEAEKTLAKFQERQKAYEVKLAEKKSAAKMLGELRAVDAKLNSQLQSIQEQVLKAQEAVRKAKANLVQQQQSVSAALAQLDQARKLVASKQLTLAQRKAEVAKAKAKFALYHQQQKVVSSVADGKHLAGSKFKVMFSGFSPYSRNKVILASTPVELGVFEADAAGNFTVEVTTPFEAGAHSVTATNAWGDWARYEFNVNASKPMIPLQPAKPMIPMLGGKSELAQPKMQQPMGEAQKMLAQTGYDVISLGVMTAASVVTGAALLVSRRRGKHSI
ncbi:hypothetical protein [Arcanobacterium hippocoleae]|uniref:hypothetical protein n=1 Tax=Arcanobacterium hippocoleae TaxID=149017 RepID=UPI00333EA084